MADTVNAQVPHTPRQLADAYLEALTAHNPGIAAMLGVNLDDDRQPDLSPEGFEAEADLARRTLADLAALPAEALREPAEDAAARLLRERLTALLAVHDAGDHFRSLSNIASPVHGVRSVFTIMPTATDADWSVVAGRLRNVGGALKGYRATLQQGLDRQLYSGPRQVETVIGQLGDWLGAEGGPSWFADFVAKGPDALRAELDAAAAEATAAAAEFRDWLSGDYAPAAAGASDIAGRELYLRASRYCTGADLDLDEAYSWGWTEFHRLYAEQLTEAERVLPGATPLEAVAHLEREGHAVQGVEEVRGWLQRLMDQADRGPRRHPLRPGGAAAGRSRRIAPPGSAAAPYYTPPPSLDFSRPGRTWLPTLGKEEFPTWELVSIWYHEGVPGHHLHLGPRCAFGPRSSHRFQMTIGRRQRRHRGLGPLRRASSWTNWASSPTRAIGSASWRARCCAPSG